MKTFGNMGRHENIHGDIKKMCEAVLKRGKTWGDSVNIVDSFDNCDSLDSVGNAKKHGKI